MRKSLTKDKKICKSNYPGGVTLFATGIPLGVENKANKKKVPELPVLISVTTVSSFHSSKALKESLWENPYGRMPLAGVSSR